LIAASISGGDLHADVVTVDEGDVVGNFARDGVKVELGSAEWRHTVPGGTTGSARGSITVAPSTDVNSTIPVRADAQVISGTSSDVHVVVNGTETGLCVEKDRFGTLIHDI
jgi:hypothetical protein